MNGNSYMRDGSAETSSNATSGGDDDSTDDAEHTDGAGPCTEVTALCWDGGAVGVARFLCAECRIEVFEAPVCLVAGELVRRRAALPLSYPSSSMTSAGSRRCETRAETRRRPRGTSAGSEGEVRILVYEDIPASLLWLTRYLEVQRPQVLLPHEGNAALVDLVAFVSVHTPIHVIRLSADTAFDATAALPRLASMYPAHISELATRFSASRVAMLRSMAALLQFVSVVQSNVADVVERGVLHALYLEEACAEALQITRTERHPSSAQGRGRAKEGLSLRAVLNTTQSALGKAMLRQWMALPCCDRAEIEARQSVVAYFAHVERHGLAAQLRTALQKVRSTTHIFTTMRSGRVLRKHYSSLHHTLRGVLMVYELVSRVAHEVDRLFILLQSIRVAPLVEMAESIARTIVGVAARRGAVGQNRIAEGATVRAGGSELGPASAVDNSVVNVLDGVDQVLDELRLRLHELSLSLQAKAEAAFAQLPWEVRALLSLRCVYAAPHGYLLTIPAVELLAVVQAYQPQMERAEGCANEAEDDVFVYSEETQGDEIEADGEDFRHRGAQVQGATGDTPWLFLPNTEETSTPVTARDQVHRFMADSFGWQLHHETQTGEYCFKSAAMEELDVWVGDLQRRIQQREQQVRRELDTTLLYGSLYLLRPTRALAELDCLLSFARVSAQEGWCRPEIVSRRTPEVTENGDGGEEEEEGILEIDNGWHPLLSHLVGLQQLIPFSIHIRTSSDRVCLILGVNGSGKSVLISAVAQIVLLAHMGCHVPAAAARLSLVSGIFAPSSTAAAAMAVPSAPCSFYGECVALHRVLHHVSGQQRSAEELGRRDNTAGRALVLLDEFGRGTAPEDGCALLQGTLRYFADGGVEEEREVLTSPGARRCPRWSRPPFVLCATHLVEMLTGMPPLSIVGPGGPGDVPKPVITAGDPLYGNMTSLLAQTERNGPECLQPRLAANLPRGNATIPLQWVKIYKMESHITYAADQAESTAAQNGEIQMNDPEKMHGASAPSRGLPVDVTPTFQPICVTPHEGMTRWEDWQRHARVQLDAGPALGRQCGLDVGLLTHWEDALKVLRTPQAGQ